MRRRIFLVEGKPGLAPSLCQEHWRDRHAELYSLTPGLRGYVQRRPLPEQWDQLQWQACAETWFDDREAEQAALASPHYRTSVAPDEERFLNRTAAWIANVVDEELFARPLAYDVLVFGPLGSSPPQPSSVIKLDRDTPVPGSREIVVLSTDDREEALALAGSSPALAIAVETMPIVPPPDAERSVLR